MVCQPARSNISTACAQTATLAEISSRWSCIASVSAKGIASAAPTPRAGQMAPKGAFVALVGGLTRPRSAPGPQAHQPVLLADACLILEPDLDWRRLRQAVEVSAQRAREVFLYASTIRSS